MSKPEAVFPARLNPNFVSLLIIAAIVICFIAALHETHFGKPSLPSSTGSAEQLRAETLKAQIWIAIAAWATILITGAGTLAIFFSLNLNREVVEEAARSNRQSSDRTKVELRAYLGIFRAYVEQFISDEQIQLRVEYGNYGKTPARAYRLTQLMFLRELPGKVGQSAPLTTQTILTPPPGVLNLNDNIVPETKREKSVRSNRNVTSAEFAELRSGNLSIVLSLNITYEDVFGSPRTLVFLGEVKASNMKQGDSLIFVLVEDRDGDFHDPVTSTILPDEQNLPL